MSVKVQSQVWEHSKAAGNTLMVLLKIADNCDDSGRNAWPSVPTLARYCRCSVSTVQRAIRDLELLGELEVVRKGGGRSGGGPYAPNLYRVVLERYQSATSQIATEVAPLQERGVIPTPPEVSPVTSNSSREPSMNPATVVSSRLATEHLALSRELLSRERQMEEEDGAITEAARSESVSSSRRDLPLSRVDDDAVDLTSRHEPPA